MGMRFGNKPAAAGMVVPSLNSPRRIPIDSFQAAGLPDGNKSAAYHATEDPLPRLG